MSEHEVNHLFDVLLYVFESFIYSEDPAILEPDQLTEELELAGFDSAAIEPALAWLEKLSELRHHGCTSLPAQQVEATRIFTAQESRVLDVECQGFLLFMEQCGALDVTSREQVIERVLDLYQTSSEKAQMTTDELKWITMMVLFAMPGRQQAFYQVESMLFDEPGEYLH